MRAISDNNVMSLLFPQGRNAPRRGETTSVIPCYQTSQYPPSDGALNDPPCLRSPGPGSRHSVGHYISLEPRRERLTDLPHACRRNDEDVCSPHCRLHNFFLLTLVIGITER